jgi:5-(carboxyamino)imidazole ribonucleotide mutase
MKEPQTTNHKPQTVLVGVIMGSDSDLSIMQAAADILTHFEIPFELTIVSAHRTPQRMFEYAQTAKERGLKVIIAGAGGAAHLPGMVAALTTLPVIGVPIKSSNSIDGWDSILSILQMPGGVPVATVALNGAKNAGILAAQIIGAFDEVVSKKIAEYKKGLNYEVMEKVESLKKSS